MLSEFLAYGQERHALETVMRLHAVKRWHMIDTTRQQTLAEHSANVALLAMTIAKTAPVNTFDTHTVVGAAALVHDIPEAFTGDVPTHTKRHIDSLDDLEEIVTPKELSIPASPATIALIKLCDLADGIRFIRLHGVDLTARHAQEGLEEQYIKKINWAIKEFEWSDNIHFHIHDNLMFYAYEANGGKAP
jgi:hypothetical protein